MGDNRDNPTPHWYYDTKDSRCRQFYYGGIGGNANNFRTESECLKRCEEKPETENKPTETVTTKRPIDPEVPTVSVKRDNQDHCQLEPEAGDCRDPEVRYYYNYGDGICKAFTYGGCGGNENNFVRRDDCEQSCLSSQDTCSLPPVVGECDGNETKWYFDVQTKRCAVFQYGGCYGNANNFPSSSECESRCVTEDSQNAVIFDDVSTILFDIV